MSSTPSLDVLAQILAPQVAAQQPPLLSIPGAVERTPHLYAAVASLAIGGAERIVLDWSAHASRTHRVHVAVLRDAMPEWATPPGVEIVRFRGNDIDLQLAQFGAQAAAEHAAGGTRVVCCHLLTAAQRHALRTGGAQTIPVLHNAAQGWIEPASALREENFAIAVSQAAAREYRAAGGRLPCAVVRHFPRKSSAGTTSRADWRSRWAIPADAWVIGMIGAVKPQKAYPRALRVLREILDGGSAPGKAYLVIVGGPTGRDGALAWSALLAQARRLEVTARLRLPGFVSEGSQCLPAFDVFLNTSRYEGRSIATLEALCAGVPVVASRVGGQDETGTEGMTLVSFDAPDAVWANALVARTRSGSRLPAWAGFPSERMWTLAHLACPVSPRRGTTRQVLFVTANLNVGGAQRSLVNLALGLKGRLDFEIAVTGNSTSGEFSAQLASSGIRHFRTAATRDCFDHAQALIAHIAANETSCVCFWNVDAKIKLLLVKWLGHRALKFVDASPGSYLFEEMAATQDFQDWIACTGEEYFARIDHLVHKYHAPRRILNRARVRVIPNGVPEARTPRTGFSRFGPDTSTSPARIALSGRIAPSKFVLEAIEAVRLLRKNIPCAQLHVIGTAEPRERDYALQVAAAALTAEDGDAGVVFHGASFGSPGELARYDALIVLGRHQGCPNSVLEGLAAGVPVIANNSGGTRELVRDGKTGLLLETIEPRAVAAALRRVLENPKLAQDLSRRGRRHVSGTFSMRRMCDAYMNLLS